MGSLYLRLNIQYYYRVEEAASELDFITFVKKLNRIKFFPGKRGYLLDNFTINTYQQQSNLKRMVI